MSRTFFIFCAFLFTICLNAQVKISLKNTTGKRVDSLKIGDMYLGTIEMDSVKTITSKMVVYDTGKPVLYLSAIVGKEKIVMDGRGYECGTYLKTFTEGEFKWNLVLFPVANGKNFLLVNADKGSR